MKIRNVSLESNLSLSWITKMTNWKQTNIKIQNLIRFLWFISRSVWTGSTGSSFNTCFCCCTRARRCGYISDKSYTQKSERFVSLFTSLITQWRSVVFPKRWALNALCGQRQCPFKFHERKLNTQTSHETNIDFTA